jgi:hypothetical protein
MKHKIGDACIKIVTEKYTDPKGIYHRAVLKSLYLLYGCM